MPDYSPVEEIDQSKPLDMSRIKYSAGDIFGAGIVSSYGNYVTNSMVEGLSKVKPDPSVPLSQPADKSYVDNLKKDRPGFNPPVGIPQFLALQLQQQYDNNQYFEKVKSRPASIMGKVGALGGGFIGSSANVKSLIYGAGGAGAAGAFIAPIAEGAITRLATNKIIGEGVAKVGTAISNSAITGGGFGLTAQIEEEAGKFEREELFNEPHHYIDALQNLGNATLYGAIAGIGFHAAGSGIGFGRDALIGKRVEISPQQELNIPPEDNFTVHNRYETPDEAQTAADVHQKSTPVPHDYRIDEAGNGDYILSKKGKGATVIKPAEFERQGGLLRKLNIPDRAKAAIEKLWKPWTREADDVTKTEAVGQMANGNLVDIEPVIKQGMYDEGVSFRDELAKEGIDPKEVDQALGDEQERIVSEMFVRHFAEREALGKKVPTPEARAELFKARNVEPVELPTNGENDTIQQEALSSINEKLKFNEDAIKRLEKDVNKFTRGKIDQEGYVKARREQELHRWAVANLKADREALLKGNRQKIKDLHDEYVAAQSIRDHINDAHEPLSQGEMEAYGQHLKESNMPDNGHSIDAGENTTVDEQLSQYSDKDVESLAESTKDSDVGGEEIRKSAEKLKNQKVYESMAQSVTDCIMKGGL